MKSQQHRRRIRAALRLICLCLCLSIIWACGRKGPPRPLKEPPVPVVHDLMARLAGDRVTLSWSTPAMGPGAHYALDGFMVFRARQALSTCRDCPVDFVMVKEIPMTDLLGGRRPSFAEQITPGYRYLYKVRAFNDFLGPGDDSNWIDFNYGPQ